MEAIQWEEQYLDTRLKQENIYTGEPSDELDDAWGELIGRMLLSPVVSFPFSQLSRLKKPQ